MLIPEVIEDLFGLLSLGTETPESQSHTTNRLMINSCDKHFKVFLFQITDFKLRIPQTTQMIILC